MSVLDPQTQVAEVPVQNIPVVNGNFTATEPTVQTPIAPVVEQTPVVQVPENAVKLSSGVYVIFNRLNRSISTDLTIKTFNNVNLDKKGNLVTDNMNTKDQMNMARSISEYHSTLIMQGVELWGDVEDYRKDLGLPNNWAKALFRSGLVNDRYYDLNDPDDVEFLFLRYYAFQDENDWALLSQNTLNT